MSATLILMPLVHRVSPHDPSWREQHERECEAQATAQFMVPPRTRPILIREPKIMESRTR